MESRINQPKFKVGDLVKTPLREGAFEITEVIHFPENTFTYLVRSRAIYPFDQDELERFDGK